jgi:hypothetical protein
MNELREYIEKVRKLPLDEHSKQALLSGTAAALLKL